jgi:alcohol dehydrogenase class IV
MWYFRSPEIVFGEDALDHLTQLTGRKAFIVTDSTMVRLGFVAQITQRLETAGFTCAVYSQVETEPTPSTIEHGATAMAKFGPDWIVALGGGSPIDAAKAMWVLYENPGMDVLTINPFEPLPMRRKARLVAISATSGTGAEATWGIVITDPADRRKVAVGSPANLPDVAIVDPALAATMPPRLTADTGMDALTHAIEGYTATWHNDFADGLCLKAARLIFDYLPRAVANGQDMEARTKLHTAAAIAGLGFMNSMCSLAHALGHSLGGLFNLPHGRCVGLFLPYTIQYNALGSASTRYRELAAFLNLPAATPAQAADSLVQAIRGLSTQIGQPTAIRQALDIAPAQFEAMLTLLVEHAENDSQLLTAERSPSTEDVRRLFLHAFDGKDIDW